MPDPISEDHVSFLRQCRPNLLQLIQANPFGTNMQLRSVDGETLSQSDFFENWYISELQSLQEATAKFEEALNSPVSISQLIFLSGFGGCGKTTFLRHFAHTHPSYHFFFLDFDHVAGEQDNPLESRLVSKLAKEPAVAFKQVGRILRSNDTVAIDFFSESTLRVLVGILPTDPIELKSQLRALNLKELIYLTLLFRLVEADRRRMTVLVFDNLDDMRVDYLSERVQTVLVEVVQFGARLAEMEGVNADFARCFRMVVCLRDLKHALRANQIQQLFDNLGGNFASVPFQLEPDVYQSIVKRRLNIAGAVYRSTISDDDEWKGVCTTALNTTESVRQLLDGLKDERFFEHILAPLYNYNLKRLAPAMLSIGSAHQAQPANANYGFFGGVLKETLKTNPAFLTYYRKYVGVGARYEKAYCLHPRVVLTVVSNLTKTDVQLGSVITLGSGRCHVDSVVASLCCVYPVIEILRTIEECFSIDAAGWSNLIVIRDKAVPSTTGIFDREIAELEKLEIFREPLRSAAELEKVPVGVREELQRVTLQLNPAGFVYLRHVLTHFEFYAAVAHEERGQHDGVFSLFDCGIRRAESGEFLFDSYIRPVFELVKEHVELMRGFFEEVYQGRLGLDVESFEVGPLSFKHWGRRSRRNRVGRLHAYRLITTSIGYVERFRRHVLGLSASPQEKAKANVRLCQHLEGFAWLLGDSVPGDRATADAEEFLAAIRKVCGSDGQDRRTLVELHRNPLDAA